MKKMQRFLAVLLVTVCGFCTLGIAQEKAVSHLAPNAYGQYLKLTGGTMTGPIIGNTNYSLFGDNWTDGLSLQDVKGDAIGMGMLKGDLQIVYMSAASGGLVTVDNAPPSGSASISDFAGDSFGITAGKFYFGVLSGSNPLPVFANNEAAISGGLEHGNLYRTGGDPDVICIVH